MAIRLCPIYEFVQATLTERNTNTDSIIKKLVTVFALAPTPKTESK